MGKRKRNRQRDLWISFGEMAKAPGHPFYERVNKVLGKAGFDDFVEPRCAKFYAAGMGRPSLAPGIYFRLLVVGYFEGLDSERGMAWRAADSLALREFSGLKLSESPPDHSTISRTRRLIDVETHEAVFSWVLKQLAESGLLKGKTRKVKIFSRPTSFYCATSCNRHGKQKSALVEPQCFPPLRLST